MSRFVSFTVYGTPVPKERHRTMRRGRRMISFTPERTVAYERMVGDTAFAAMCVSFSIKLHDSPLSWSAYALFDKPCGLCTMVYRKMSKGDLSNLTKSIEDGMNKVVYTDDRLVKVHHTWMGESKDDPRVDVLVWELSPEELSGSTVAAILESKRNGNVR